MRTANIQLGTARERSDRTRNGQLRLCRSTSRTILLAAHVVNHKSSEASATINCQLQAKRTWNYRLRRSRPGTYPFLVSERLRIASDASEITAKTRREARLNPSETDLPRLCEACVMLACFSRVAEVLLAASHGHISVLRQRVTAVNNQHSTANLLVLTQRRKGTCGLLRPRQIDRASLMSLMSLSSLKHLRANS